MAVNDAITRRYQLLGKRLEQEERGRTQEEQEALQRRFAAIGGLGSGASIKTQQLAQQAASKRVAQGKEALGIAEMQERQRQDEIQEQRAFQTGERLGSEKFAAQQAGLGREFARGERLGGQEFTAGQAALQRRYLTGEREAGQAFGAEQAAIGRKFATSEREAGQKFGAEQAAIGREFAAGETQKERDLKQYIADIDNKYKEATFEWQKIAWQTEFDLNKLISMENLAMAKEALAQGGGGILDTVFGPGTTNTVTEKAKSPIDPTGKGTVASSIFFPTFIPTTAGISWASKNLSTITKNIRPIQPPRISL